MCKATSEQMSKPLRGCLGCFWHHQCPSTSSTLTFAQMALMESCVGLLLHLASRSSGGKILINMNSYKNYDREIGEHLSYWGKEQQQNVAVEPRNPGSALIRWIQPATSAEVVFVICSWAATQSSEHSCVIQYYLYPRHGDKQHPSAPVRKNAFQLPLVSFHLSFLFKYERESGWCIY